MQVRACVGVLAYVELVRAPVRVPVHLCAGAPVKLGGRVRVCVGVQCQCGCLYVFVYK